MTRAILKNVLLIEDPPEEAAARAKQMLTFRWQEQVTKDRQETKEHRAYKVRGSDLLVPGGFTEYLSRAGLPAEYEDGTVAPFVRGPFHPTITLRPHQEPIRGIGLMHRCGVIQANPGFGKTAVTISELVCHYQTPTLVIVKTDDLRRQWIDRLREQTSLTDERIGTIGKGKWEPADVTVALWQTLSRRLPRMKQEDREAYREFTRRFGLLLVDECHGAPAQKLSQVINAFPARYKWGCTATPFRNDALTRMILYLLGPIRYAAEKPKDDVPVFFRQIPIPGTEYGWAPDWNLFRQAMSNDLSRADWVAQDIAERAETPCLVIFRELDPLRQMYEKMRELRPDSNVVLFTGETKRDEREAIREAGQRGEIDYCFSSTIADEGLDWPPLRTVCLTYPLSFSGKVIQQTGRVSRRYPGKNAATILDYYDRHFIPRKQKRKRFVTYKSQGYEKIQ